jgi:hypothetical protein
VAFQERRKTNERCGELEIALRTPSDTALNWLTHAPPGAVTGLASRAKTASIWPSSCTGARMTSTLKEKKEQTSVFEGIRGGDQLQHNG